MEVVDPDPILGQAIANFPSNRLRPLITAGIVIAPVALALGLTTAQVTDWWGPVVTVVVMALVALALAWYVLHLWNREIILYELGFSYREGSKTVFFRYDEIASIRLQAERLAYFGGLLRRDVYRYTVTTTEAERFVITNLYRRAAELGTRLTDAINRTLGPKLAQQFADGGKIAFGDTLRAGRDGLYNGGAVLAWDDFGGYRIGGGKLSLLSGSSDVWLSLPHAEVDNITLLLEILREYQAVARG